MDNILHMVGLAKRAGRLEVGEEPVGAVCRARDCRLILVARDAADNSFRRVRHFADAGQCLWISVPYTKDELGSAVGRTSCAMAAVTDVGFAEAIVKKLAQQYGLTLIDLQAGWDELFQHMHPCNIAWDRIHPNQTGCMYIAKQFLKAVGAERC